jgi:hypothetical protein
MGSSGVFFIISNEVYQPFPYLISKKGCEAIKSRIKGHVDLT